MSDDRPNMLHYHHLTTNFSEQFGGLYSVTPVNLTGEGHRAHIELRFRFGARFDLMPEDFAALLQQGPAAMAKLPLIPDVHDAILDEDGEEYA